MKSSIWKGLTVVLVVTAGMFLSGCQDALCTSLSVEGISQGLNDVGSFVCSSEGFSFSGGNDSTQLVISGNVDG